MANPNTKTSVQELNAVPLGFTLAESAPAGASTFTGHENEMSRNMHGDLRRSAIVHVFNFKGRPDQVDRMPGLGEISMGAPHPWHKGSFVTNVAFEHEVPNETDEQQWTKATVVFEQRPCPGRYEESTTTTYKSQNEWYTRVPIALPPDNVNRIRSLTGTRQAIPVMVPQRVVIRHWPRVKLSKPQKENIESEVGYVNGVTFYNRPQEYWFFEQAKFDLLWSESGHGSDIGHYEVTLIWREDKFRRHRLFWPQADSSPWIPVEPQANQTYDDLHLQLPVYPRSGTDWETLVPLDEDSCTPRRGMGLTDF